MPMRIHIHPAPGCPGGHAAFCPAIPERGCFRINQGVNRGSFVCIHVFGEQITPPEAQFIAHLVGTRVLSPSGDGSATLAGSPPPSVVTGLLRTGNVSTKPTPYANG